MLSQHILEVVKNQCEFFICYFILAMKRTPNDQRLLISSVVA